MNKPPVKYTRKKLIRNVKLQNTPFFGLVKDLAELILSHTNLEDVFKLMLVSRNTKLITSNEQYWQKQAYILFHKKEIDRNMKLLMANRNFAKSKSKYRLLVVKMITKPQYDKIYKEILNNKRFSDVGYYMYQDVIDLLKSTICLYIRWISFRPMDDYISLIKLSFPETLELDNTTILFHLEIFTCYSKDKSRYSLISAIIKIIQITHILSWNNNILDVEGLIYALDKIRTFINNPENIFIKIITPYLRDPKIPYICKNRKCGHQSCIKRRN